LSTELTSLDAVGRSAATLTRSHQIDEWLVGRRYLSLDSLAPLLEERRDHGEEVPALTAA
jgi:hypothetical protein